VTTLWNNIKCNILMVWCGPLHSSFLDNVACVCTNIQQVASKEEEEEEEEDTPHIDTRCNARVWVDYFGDLH
jgi:Na+/H+ antiporter NhaD/arsenite permease-like protein